MISDSTSPQDEKYQHLLDNLNLNKSDKIDTITDNILYRILNDLELHVIDFDNKDKQVVYIHQINADKGILHLNKAIPIHIKKTKHGVQVYQPDTNLHCEYANLRSALNHIQNCFYEGYENAMKNETSLSEFYQEIIKKCISF